MEDNDKELDFNDLFRWLKILLFKLSELIFFIFSFSFRKKYFIFFFMVCGVLLSHLYFLMRPSNVRLNVIVSSLQKNGVSSYYFKEIINCLNDRIDYVDNSGLREKLNVPSNIAKSILNINFNTQGDPDSLYFYPLLITLEISDPTYGKLISNSVVNYLNNVYIFKTSIQRNLRINEDLIKINEDGIENLQKLRSILEREGPLLNRDKNIYVAGSINYLNIYDRIVDMKARNRIIFEDIKVVKSFELVDFSVKYLSSPNYRFKLLLFGFLSGYVVGFIICFFTYKKLK